MLYNSFLFFTPGMYHDLIFAQENTSDDDDVEEKPVEKVPIKYEDKYLDQIRQMKKEYVFNEEENELEMSKTIEFYNSITKDYTEKIEFHQNQISDIGQEIMDSDCLEEFKELCASSKEEKNKDWYEEINVCKNAMNIFESKLKDVGDIEREAKELAKNIVINQRLDKLKDSFVMEKTPCGNVLMVYNNKRGSFEFYSDNTIPYRYLETVGRKYVKMFNCRPLYIDMEEELKICEEKYEKEKEEKEKEEKKKLEEVSVKNQSDVKKNVFAKFKSYNKEAGSGRVNNAPPPKNSIPNRAVTESNPNEKVLLKENANRYSYEGKLSNFNILKKVERKVVDKKYGMTFADFKKMKNGGV